MCFLTYKYGTIVNKMLLASIALLSSDETYFYLQYVSEKKKKINRIFLMAKLLQIKMEIAI